MGILYVFLSSLSRQLDRQLDRLPDKLTDLKN